MAKSDNFYLRAEVLCPADETINEVELDLGSYVNLGMKASTLLRINAVDVAYQDANGLVPAVDAGGAAYANWVLATQSSTTMTRLEDRSVVSSGAVQMYNATAGAGSPSAISDQSDINPRELIGGYDIAVDTLYLRGTADDAFNESVYIGIVLECEQISATRDNATALAISQT
jgi:hypothetical protein